MDGRVLSTGVTPTSIAALGHNPRGTGLDDETTRAAAGQLSRILRLSNFKPGGIA